MLSRLLVSLPLLALVAGCGALNFAHPVEVNHPIQRTPSGATFRDVLPGIGHAVAPGDKVRVHYTVNVLGGGLVDSSRDRGLPDEFEVGFAPIDGWNEAIVGMRPGGQREIEVPPDLAYGAEGVEGIVPPMATLLCSIELIAVADPDWP
ncbi:MAG: peptidylprolyl isomerase [Planctomycetota bacterium]|jgi:peptidylprolyl isomerase